MALFERDQRARRALVYKAQIEQDRLVDRLCARLRALAHDRAQRIEAAHAVAQAAAEKADEQAGIVASELLGQDVSASEIVALCGDDLVTANWLKQLPKSSEPGQTQT
jgi:hypothetical protein